MDSTECSSLSYTRDVMNKIKNCKGGEVKRGELIKRAIISSKIFGEVSRNIDRLDREFDMKYKLMFNLSSKNKERLYGNSSKNTKIDDLISSINTEEIKGPLQNLLGTISDPELGLKIMRLQASSHNSRESWDAICCYLNQILIPEDPASFIQDDD